MPPNTDNNINTSSSSAQGHSSMKSFTSKAEQFMKHTEQHALQGVNPGGIYQAIWSRDASFILRSWFHSGNIHGVLQQISIIWSHQIVAGNEKVIYGRGSPEMKYKPIVAKEDKQKMFEGSLPTTMYQAGYSEVYGLNPDIDSTALMVSTTSWILAKILKEADGIQRDPPKITTSSLQGNNDNISESKSMTRHHKVIDFVVPRMLRAIDYLTTRDTDGDGLLEQNHNEDWMDTGLRAGKITYSQGCWVLALNNFSYLLSELGKYDEAEKLMKIASKTISAVEKKLWSEDDGCYIDILESHHIGGPYRTLTQDVSLYLVAISENTNSDSLRIHRNNTNFNSNSHNKGGGIQQDHPLRQQKDTYLQENPDMLLRRANSTLDAIAKRVWLDSWPTNVETLLKSTGPWHLKPYFYHNRTFWPWITGIEILARSRFNRFNECDILLSKLSSEEKVHILTFYEWINPKTSEGGGAYPFRTGICTVRWAIDHIVNSIKQGKHSNNQHWY